MVPGGPLPAPMMRIGPYVVRARLAEGGMAAVYSATRDGRPVALKMIREELVRNGEFLTMFLEEARIVSRLHHPNVVQTLEAGRECGQAYIAMELLAGQSLHAVWDACHTRVVRLRYEMIAWIGARVADGLHYAHELRDEQGAPLDIVHRDVNPSNIFITYEGVIKVIDFGLAKAANRAFKTATGIIKGKVAYMSPEQARGLPVDRRTDVFALGTTLWELACDRRLFKGDDDVRTLERVHAAKVPDPTRLVAGFPPALWEALAPALARDPGDRYSTAAEMARALDAFAGPGVDAAAVADVMRELFPVERAAPVAQPPSATGTSPGKRALPIVLIIAAVVTVVIGVALALR